MEMNILIKRMAIGVAIILCGLATTAYIMNRRSKNEAMLFDKLEHLNDRA